MKTLFIVSGTTVETTPGICVACISTYEENQTQISLLPTANNRVKIIMKNPGFKTMRENHCDGDNLSVI